MAEVGPAGSSTVVEAVEAIPRRERAAVARRIFEQLPPTERWNVVERVFEDTEVREAIAAERDLIRAVAVSALARRSVVTGVRVNRLIDTRDIAPDEEVMVGLFAASDVDVAVDRGHRSATCARRVVFRSEGGGLLRVVTDVFNPRGGYFVRAEYDEQTWRTSDRLAPHSLVRLGSLTEDSDGPRFEPMLYPGARVDVEIAGRVVPGKLHMGYVMIGDDDLFVQGDSPA